MPAVPFTSGLAPAPSGNVREGTDAAVAAFRRLQTKVGTIMLAHERPDGGLICERHRPGAPPLFYRVSPSGRVQADRRYDWNLQRFVPVPLPAGID
ncbi:MAG TPA: hypothetical protein VMF07_07060 [Solirubrobacteraceae bacterium]|nr:hypothetical protein [Solirubrobacteraceae bacterium]